MWNRLLCVQTSHEANCVNRSINCSESNKHIVYSLWQPAKSSECVWTPPGTQTSEWLVQMGDIDLRHISGSEEESRAINWRHIQHRFRLWLTTNPKCRQWNTRFMTPLEFKGKPDELTLYHKTPQFVISRKLLSKQLLKPEVESKLHLSAICVWLPGGSPPRNSPVHISPRSGCRLYTFCTDSTNLLE